MNIYYIYMLNKTLVFLALCISCAFSAVNFPYPQEANYGNGTINTKAANASANLKSKFTSFMGSHYEEGTCKSSPCARIKFDNTAQTVSEGIAYGMIMMVYFSDNTTSYQSHFDKLWVYYNNFTNDNGIMGWSVNGFSSLNDQGAATDAEFDAAFALIMAYYQFGGQKYLDDALGLIVKIRTHEMETDGLHKPGDKWFQSAENNRNPSYISPAAFELFKDLDDEAFWNMAITRNYTLLKNNQHSTTGLPSGWSNGAGTPQRDGTFDYDASRAPWRWAWTNAWFGHLSNHADIRTLLSKLAAWVNNQTPSNVGGPIQTNGTMGGHKNSTFVGPLTNALSYSSDYQTKKDAFWSTLIGINDDSYFNKAMQLITGLFSSGNMPNLKALSEVPSSSSVVPSSSSLASSSSSSQRSSSSLASSSSSLVSSSSGGTPVLLSQLVFSNSLSAMQSSVNLQVTSNAAIRIFDLKGNAIRTQSFAQGSYIVQMADLPKGLYFVKATSGSWKSTIAVPVK